MSRVVVDLTWLASADPGELRGWLSASLSRRAGDREEDPEAFLVGLLRAPSGAVDRGPAARLRCAAVYAVGGAVRDLLDEESGGASSPPRAHGLMRLCQQVHLPATRPWFDAEVVALARGPASYGARRLVPLVELLCAAVAQAPVAPGVAPEVREAWVGLLGSPSSTTFALLALGRTFREQAPYLRAWWSTCDAGERRRELEQILLSALNGCGRSEVEEVVHEHDPDFPMDLARVVDELLRDAQPAPRPA